MEAIENQIEPAQTQSPVARPWGFWATIGFSACIGVACLVLCVIVSVGYIFASKARNPELDIMELAHSLESSSTFYAITAIGSSLPILGLVLLFAKIRKNITIRDYLYLQPPNRHQLLKWSLMVLLYIGTMETIGFVLTFTGRPFVSEFMVSTYSTIRFKSLLWVAVVVAAPLTEELLFRGFIFRGIASSRLGTIGATLITSLTWTAMHIQYDAIILVGTFVGGLLLSWALVKTKSIVVPIVMHVIWNLLATIEVAIYLKFT